MATTFRQPNTRRRFVDPNQFRLFTPTDVEKQVEKVSRVKSLLELEICKAGSECVSSIYASLVEIRKFVPNRTEPLTYLPGKWEKIKDDMAQRQEWPRRDHIMEIFHFSKIVKGHKNSEISKEGKNIFYAIKALMILENLDLQIKMQDYTRVQKTIDTLSKMREGSLARFTYERIDVYANPTQEEFGGQKPN